MQAGKFRELGDNLSYIGVPDSACNDAFNRGKILTELGFVCPDGLYFVDQDHAVRGPALSPNRHDCMRIRQVGQQQMDKEDFGRIEGKWACRQVVPQEPRLTFF